MPPLADGLLARLEAEARAENPELAAALRSPDDDLPQIPSAPPPKPPAKKAEPPKPKKKKERKIQPSWTLDLSLKSIHPTVFETPIYNVLEIARTNGFLLPPEGDASSESDISAHGSDDEDDADSDVGHTSGKDAEKSEREKSPEAQDPISAPDIATKTGLSALAMIEKYKASQAAKKGAPRKRRVQPRDEGYDTDDSFVDDAELEINEPKFAVKPAREGFFIHTGLVEVFDPSAKRNAKKTATTATGKGKTAATKDVPARKKQKANTPPPDGKKGTPGPSTPKASPGTRDSPVVVDDSPKKTVPNFGGDTPQKHRVTLKALKPEVIEALESMRPAIQKESFVPKNKFPEALKPVLHDVCRIAVDAGDFDESFFAYLPRLLPYNLFTLKKLVKRDMFNYRIGFLEEQQRVLIEKFKTDVQAKLPQQEQAHEDALVVYRLAKARWDAAHPDAPTTKLPEKDKDAENEGEDEGEGDGDATMADITMADTTMADVTMADATPVPQTDGETPDPEAREKKDDKEPVEPKKKFRFDEELRMQLYGIWVFETAMVDIRAEKAELEKSNEKHSQALAVKALYAKLAAFLPDGWINTGQMSREMSTAKKKVEKMQEQEGK